MTIKLQADDIPEMLSFKDAKSDLARISKLLSTTTDIFAFGLRLSSIESLTTLLKKYFLKLEEVNDE